MIANGNSNNINARAIRISNIEINTCFITYNLIHNKFVSSHFQIDSSGATILNS